MAGGLVGMLFCIAVVLGQTPDANSRYALVDLLVFGADLPVDMASYPPYVRAELEKYLQRDRRYRSKRPRPANSPDSEMLFHALVRYERRLAAVTDDPKAAVLALAYVDNLRPCYEWEGFHECPEREAMFAAEYQRAHPRGPFRNYLPLLAAHRWLCTAEAYDYEKQPEDAARSRDLYRQALATAHKSPLRLVRNAAAELAKRQRCFA